MASVRRKSSTVLATQTLLQKKSKNLLVKVEGPLPRGCTRRNIVLAIIGKIGTAGGNGYAIEFGGFDHPSIVHGRPHDGLQHGDRSGRPGRHGLLSMKPPSTT